VLLDITAQGNNLSPEQWYAGLLDALGEQLGLEDEVEDFWRAEQRRSPLQRFMLAMREVVLARTTSNLMVFIDEIDFVLSLPFSTDELFAAIRECYNRRAEDPAYHRLTFCLIGVATPSDLIRDARVTPFNIGHRIELTDFTLQEARPLASGLLKADGHPSAVLELRRGWLLERILYWTGGHPYLTQRLCQTVAAERTRRMADVDRLCHELFLEHRAQTQDNNLAFVRERILRSQEDLASLLTLYKQVRSGKRVPNDEANPLLDVLRLSGIVRPGNDRLHVRNRIYNRVFDNNWIVDNMPDAELRRQKMAYRMGVLRTAILSAVIFSFIGTLAVRSSRLARSAQQREQNTRRLLTLQIWR
jgi:hypothetical protein